MYDLVKALHVRGYDVSVATHEISQFEYKMPVITLVLPLRPSIVNNIASGFTLSRIADQFDVLIMSNPYAVLDFVTSILTKTRVIWWCHEPRRMIFWKEIGDATSVDTISQHLKRPLLKLLTWIFASRCGALIVHSNYMKNLVKALFRTKRLCVIPLGVELQKYPYTPLLKNKRVLYVGRLAEVKNVRRLIQAFAMIDDKQAKLVIIGEGAVSDNESTMRLIEKLGIGESVLWKKRVDDVISEYKESEMVVYPCINEPFGIVPLEAMAIGRPVIAARVGGPAETVVNEETGLLIDPYDTKEISYAITRVLRNKDSFKMGLNGRKRVETRYSYDEFLSTVEHALESLIQQ